MSLDNFKSRLEARINEEASKKAHGLAEVAGRNPSEDNAARGYILALKDVFEWSNEIFRLMNGAELASRPLGRDEPGESGNPYEV